MFGLLSCFSHGLRTSIYEASRLALPLVAPGLLDIQVIITKKKKKSHFFLNATFPFNHLISFSFFNCVGSANRVVSRHGSGDNAEDTVRGAETTVTSQSVRQHRGSYAFHVASRWPQRPLSRHRRYSSPRGSLLRRWHGTLQPIEEAGGETARESA